MSNHRHSRRISRNLLKRGTMRRKRIEDLQVGECLRHDLRSKFGTLICKGDKKLSRDDISRIIDHKKRGLLPVCRATIYKPGQAIFKKEKDCLILDDVIRTEIVEMYKKDLDPDEVEFIALEITNNVLDKMKKDYDFSLEDQLSDYANLYNQSVDVAVVATSIGWYYCKEYSNTLSNAPYEYLRNLAMAGLLHDIGTIKIEPKIINKKGALSVKEWESVMSHPDEGVKIIRKIFNLNVNANVISGIGLHHVDYDGKKGYPYRALHGDNISVFAQILHVADSFVAMTMERKYREDFSPAEVFQYIRDNRGKKFSPVICDILLNHFQAYSLGEIVTLSNNDPARIVDFSKNPFRPVIQLFKTINAVTKEGHVRIFMAGSSVDLSTCEELMDMEIISCEDIRYHNHFEDEKRRMKNYNAAMLIVNERNTFYPNARKI